MHKNKCRIISCVLILSALLSGCAVSTVEETTDTAPVLSSSTTVTTVTEKTSVTETTETTTVQTTEEIKPLEFDPHVYSCFLEACYGDDYRESFFNLIDALQEGRDSFECKSKKIYDFLMDDVVQNQLYPFACMQIEKKSKKDKKSYKDGIGYIRYTKSKEDFLLRYEDFKKDIMAILDAYIKPDYTDFEKCLALYEYMVCNYEYDYDDSLNRSGGSCLAFLKYKKGICADFSALYSYLLLQCGVDAIAVSNWGEDDTTGYHSWTFVDIDGKGYHIDTTWGVKEDKTSPTFKLDYFMMTDEDRALDGYPKEELDIYILPFFYARDCKDYDFSANDSSYRLPRYSECSRYDTRSNTIYYYNYLIDSDEHQFKYE